MGRVALEITAARPDPALLDLPWELPLEEWPESYLAALPRGISRHVVRFVRLSNRVLAVKEIKTDIAFREYHMLRTLGRLDLPCVEPFGIVSGREQADGTDLDGCLVTRHLQFSLPYRALFSQSLRPDTGKDLHRVTTVIGSGGVLRHADPAAAVALVRAAIDDPGGGWRTPDRATCVVDRTYVLAAAGLLADRDRDAAIAVLISAGFVAKSLAT